jgi:hypothetical protein
MNGRVTQVPRLVVIEPTDAVVRVTDLNRRVVIEPTDATIRSTMLCRLVVIAEETTTNAITTQLSRLVAVEVPPPELGERAYGYIIG